MKLRLMKLIKNDKKELIKIVKGKTSLCSDLMGSLVGVLSEFNFVNFRKYILNILK